MCVLGAAREAGENDCVVVVSLNHFKNAQLHWTDTVGSPWKIRYTRRYGRQGHRLAHKEIRVFVYQNHLVSSNFVLRPSV